MNNRLETIIDLKKYPIHVERNQEDFLSKKHVGKLVLVPPY